mgnify:CR=1 FL=1
MKTTTILIVLLALAGCADLGPPRQRIKPYVNPITIEFRERTICSENLPDGTVRACTCEVQP